MKYKIIRTKGGYLQGLKEHYINNGVALTLKEWCSYFGYKSAKSIETLIKRKNNKCNNNDYYYISYSYEVVE